MGLPLLRLRPNPTRHIALAVRSANEAKALRECPRLGPSCGSVTGRSDVQKPPAMAGIYLNKMSIHIPARCRCLSNSGTGFSNPHGGSTRVGASNPWHLISSTILKLQIERYEAEAFVPQHSESLHRPHSRPTFARMKRDPCFSFTRGSGNERRARSPTYFFRSAVTPASHAGLDADSQRHS